MTQAEKNQQEKLDRLFEQCYKDENFKQALIDNPVATIESFFGERLHQKDHLNYVVTDQTSRSTVYINIPPNPNVEDVELTEEELEAVAGGWYVNLLWSSICFGSGEGGPDNADLSVSAA